MNRNTKKSASKTPLRDTVRYYVSPINICERPTIPVTESQLHGLLEEQALAELHDLPYVYERRVTA